MQAPGQTQQSSPTTETSLPSLCQDRLLYPDFANKTWTPHIRSPLTPEQALENRECNSYYFNYTDLQYTIFWGINLPALSSADSFEGALRDFQVMLETDLEECIAECAKYTVQTPYGYNHAQDVCVAVTVDVYGTCWLKKAMNTPKWPPDGGLRFLRPGPGGNGSALWNWGPSMDLKSMWS